MGCCTGAPPEDMRHCDAAPIRLRMPQHGSIVRADATSISRMKRPSRRIQTSVNSSPMATFASRSNSSAQSAQAINCNNLYRFSHPRTRHKNHPRTDRRTAHRGQDLCGPADHKPHALDRRGVASAPSHAADTGPAHAPACLSEYRRLGPGAGWA